MCDPLVATFLREAATAYGRYRERPPPSGLRPCPTLTASCFARAGEATAPRTERVAATPVQKGPALPFTLAWQGFNRKAGIEPA
jgi:hypothetical protein